MSFENPNQIKEALPQKTERESALKERLDKVVNLPYEEEWVQRWLADILGHKDADEEIEYFFKNVENSKPLREALNKDLKLFEMLFFEAGKYIFDDPKSIEIMVHGVIERDKEISRNQKEKQKRILTNPQATEEEYKLGAYKEALESQVRDAVFALQTKGYSPMESGFYELPNGSQYIGINNNEGLDGKTIIDSLNNKIDYKALGILRMPINVIEGRIQIIIVPQDPMLSLDDWEVIWDKVVACLPVINIAGGNVRASDNGTQGERFRDAQDKIKAGKNAWLSPGLAYVNGKVVSMSYQDFIYLEKKP